MKRRLLVAVLAVVAGVPAAMPATASAGGGKQPYVVVLRDAAGDSTARVQRSRRATASRRS